MKILINVSTLRSGGGFQVGLNVLATCLSNDNNNNFYYLINKNFINEVDFPKDKTFIVDDYPSNIFNFKNKKNIYKYLKDLKPDIVYSVGSPSYLNFKDSIEVMRLTNPWLIYSNQIAFKKINIYHKLKLKSQIFLKKIFLKNIDYFITQTEDAKINISKNLNKELENIKVIPNIYSYNLEKYKNIEFNKSYDNLINVLIFSANYFHKNISISISMAKELKQRKINNIRFVLTLPDEEFITLKKEINFYGLDSYFLNKGKIKLDQIPKLYKDAHILFLPTLLEVFSVTFLEAMIFKLPIITTDLSFNRDVCKNSALYFKDFEKGIDALDMIHKLIKSEDLRNNLIINGCNIVNDYKNNRNMYMEHIYYLKKIYDAN